MPPADLPDQLTIPSYPMPLMGALSDGTMLSAFAEQHLIKWRKGNTRARYPYPTRDFILGPQKAYTGQMKPETMSQEWISTDVESIEDLEVSMFGLSHMMGQAAGQKIDEMAREVMMATTGGYNSNWYTWNDSTTGTSGNYASGGDLSAYNSSTSQWVWNAWSVGTGDTSDGTNTVAGNQIIMRYTWGVWNQTVEETAAERATREAREIVQAEVAEQRMAEQRERLRIQKEEQAEASAKATALLREILDEQQVKDFDATKTFIVVAASKKLYKIRAGSSPLEVSPDGKTLASFCIHPRSQHGLPNEDLMLAHKLMLEDNEKNWLSIANRSPR